MRCGRGAAAIERSGSPWPAAQGTASLEATIFSYDGQDFIRTRTTMLTEAGKPAVNTKLEHDTPAYKALVQKHSFTGDVTVFGKRYDASYAPLTDQGGRLTGARSWGYASRTPRLEPPRLPVVAAARQS